MDETAKGGSLRSEMVMALAFVAVLGILIVPLPAEALDFLLTFNVGLSLLMLLVALTLKKPLDFSVFPSMLLITTLFRLGLNIAVTRLILMHGSEGVGAAGHV